MLFPITWNTSIFYERYQEIINQYNAEQDRATIEKTFMDLMVLASNGLTACDRYAGYHTMKYVYIDRLL